MIHIMNNQWKNITELKFIEILNLKNYDNFKLPNLKCCYLKFSNTK